MFEHLQHERALDRPDFACPQRDLPHERFRERLLDELVHGIHWWSLLAEIVQGHVKKPCQGVHSLKRYGADPALA